MITTQQLAEIRARVEKTTPGKWEAWTARETQAPGTLRAMVLRENPDNDFDFICEFPRRSAKDAKPDASFIAHAHADVPALLDEVDRLKKVSAETWEVACNEAGLICADTYSLKEKRELTLSELVQHAIRSSKNEATWDAKIAALNPPKRKRR